MKKYTVIIRELSVNRKEISKFQHITILDIVLSTYTAKNGFQFLS